VAADPAPESPESSVDVATGAETELRGDVAAKLRYYVEPVFPCPLAARFGLFLHVPSQATSSLYFDKDVFDELSLALELGTDEVIHAIVPFDHLSDRLLDCVRQLVKGARRRFMSAMLEPT
jgi:hypothetical protein